MAETIKYTPKGVCSHLITITHEDGIIKEAMIHGGCPGNTRGVSLLVTGLSISEAIRKLRGIQCRNGTSCPDQLAIALETIK